MKILKNKTGQMRMVVGLGSALATLSILLVTSFLVLARGKSEIKTIEGLNSTSCETSLGCNATEVLESAIGDIPAWIPIVIVVIIGTAILGIVALLRPKE